MSMITLLIINSLLVIAIILLINLKWITKTIREICHKNNEGGYAKFIQLLIIFLLITIFIIIVIYYIINKSEVDKIDVILTVVVGWLGAVIGRFFGERVMAQVEQKQKEGVKKTELLMEKQENFIDEIIKKLNKK